MIARETDRHSDRSFLSCSNLAHGFAASGEDKATIAGNKAVNLGIVTAYNDMLSAHQPYGRYPEQMKLFAREVGATAQVAGGVPAMCDGVTQGFDGMELSLFSRDVIALSTGVALSHAMFDGMALLGICDKIVPGLVIGALRFASSTPRARSAARNCSPAKAPAITRRAPAPSTAPPTPTR
jgi:phosphogluconate dehydratase